MAKSGAQCVETNDFEEAKRRYENAYARWKDHWFEICCTIYEKSKEWAKKYIIDYVNKVINTVKNLFIRRDDPCFTYIVKIFDTEGVWRYTKVGKAKELHKRLKQIKNKGWVNCKVGNIDIIKMYITPSEHYAEMLENHIKEYLTMVYKDRYVPNDRFDAFEPTEADFQAFEIRHQEILEIAQKYKEILV